MFHIKFSKKGAFSSLSPPLLRPRLSLREHKQRFTHRLMVLPSLMESNAELTEPGFKKSSTTSQGQVVRDVLLSLSNQYVKCASLSLPGPHRASG